MFQIPVLAAQISNFELVKGALSCLGAGRGVDVGGVEVKARSAAGGVFRVKFCRNRKLVNVETSGAFTQTS